MSANHEEKVVASRAKLQFYSYSVVNPDWHLDEHIPVLVYDLCRASAIELEFAGKLMPYWADSDHGLQENQRKGKISSRKVQKRAT
jgi:hypothetical protein